MQYHSKFYQSALRRGKVIDNINHCILWLNYNKNKSILYGTCNVEFHYQRFCAQYPHLILNKVPYGIEIKYPKCEA